VNCGTGTNILIGAREGVLYRITPRENDAVNSCWMPDSHRLNYHYVNDERRLRAPLVKNAPAPWGDAIAEAARQLRALEPSQLALIASARLTNEELFLARRLAEALGITHFDVLPRPQEGDGFLVSNDGNPNTTGAKLLGLTGVTPGSKLPGIASAVAAGTVRGLVVLGEDATKCGIAESDLAKLSALVATDILPNKTTPHASVLLPASAFAEKRGTMINLAGRIQRLNRAISAPGQARNDWEILRDLIVAVGGANGVYSIEDVFKAMAAETSELEGLSLAGIGDLGVQLALGESSARR
jgi:NADH-quinone oxidoreductase subunit G